MPDATRFTVIRGTDHHGEVKRYGSLDPTRVPAALRHLVPAAEQWGIGDDALREREADLMPPDERALLAAEIKRLQLDFADWLGGPEAKGPKFTDEYLAFSALWMQF